jgi:hypothetical protein
MMTKLRKGVSKSIRCFPRFDGGHPVGMGGGGRRGGTGGGTGGGQGGGK